jgi:hypothetical protein
MKRGEGKRECFLRWDGGDKRVRCGECFSGWWCVGVVEGAARVKVMGLVSRLFLWVVEGIYPPWVGFGS